MANNLPTALQSLVSPDDFSIQDAARNHLGTDADGNHVFLLLVRAKALNPAAEKDAVSEDADTPYQDITMPESEIKGGTHLNMQLAKAIERSAALSGDCQKTHCAGSTRNWQKTVRPHRRRAMPGGEMVPLVAEHNGSTMSAKDELGMIADVARLLHPLLADSQPL